MNIARYFRAEKQHDLGQGFGGYPTAEISVGRGNSILRRIDSAGQDAVYIDAEAFYFGRGALDEPDDGDKRRLTDAPTRSDESS